MPKYDGTLYVSFSFEGAYGKDEDDLERRALAAVKSGTLDSRLREGDLQLEDVSSSGPRSCDVTVEADVHLRYSTCTELDEDEAEALEASTGCLTDTLQTLGLDESYYDEATTVEIGVEIEWDEDDEPDEDDPFWVNPSGEMLYHEAEVENVAQRETPMVTFEATPTEAPVITRSDDAPAPVEAPTEIDE